ncbi:hypothetical protein J6590_064050 [Homalodisca vitripennis]|nr:hypothetical protein J6590_064050 [Homalodisca vitripennis]
MKDEILFLLDIFKSTKNCEILSILRDKRKAYKRALQTSKLSFNATRIEEASNKCSMAWIIISEAAGKPSKHNLGDVSPDCFNNYFLSLVEEISAKVRGSVDGVVKCIEKSAKPNTSFSLSQVSCEQVLSVMKSLKISESKDVYGLTRFKLFNDNQFGYREGCSTIMAVDSLVTELYLAVEEKRIARVTLCDLSKAFDCVAHDIQNTAECYLEYYLNNEDLPGANAMQPQRRDLCRPRSKHPPQIVLSQRHHEPRTTLQGCYTARKGIPQTTCRYYKRLVIYSSSVQRHAEYRRYLFRAEDEI